MISPLKSVGATTLSLSLLLLLLALLQPLGVCLAQPASDPQLWVNDCNTPKSLWLSIYSSSDERCFGEWNNLVSSSPTPLLMCPYGMLGSNPFRVSMSAGPFAYTGSLSQFRIRLKESESPSVELPVGVNSASTSAYVHSPLRPHNYTISFSRDKSQGACHVAADPSTCGACYWSQKLQLRFFGSAGFAPQSTPVILAANITASCAATNTDASAVLPVLDAQEITAANVHLHVSVVVAVLASDDPSWQAIDGTVLVQLWAQRLQSLYDGSSSSSSSSSNLDHVAQSPVLLGVVALSQAQLPWSPSSAAALGSDAAVLLVWALSAANSRSLCALLQPRANGSIIDASDSVLVLQLRLLSNRSAALSGYSNAIAIGGANCTCRCSSSCLSRGLVEQSGTGREDSSSSSSSSGDGGGGDGGDVADSSTADAVTATAASPTATAVDDIQSSSGSDESDSSASSSSSNMKPGQPLSSTAAAVSVAVVSSSSSAEGAINNSAQEGVNNVSAAAPSRNTQLRAPLPCAMAIFALLGASMV